MEPASDAEAIVRSLEEPRHFAVVFDRHASVLLRFFVRRVGPDTAGALVGETFRIAFERRPSFDTERPSALPWLYGIAANVLSRHRRAEGRRLRATARLAARRLPADDSVERALAAADARQRWPRVAEALASLPDGEREVVLLYAWEDLGYAEIATALDIPVGTVRSRLNRARRRLRELDTPSGEEESNASSATARISP